MSNMSKGLEITNLKASIEDKEILKGIDLVVKPGEVHAIMGPNGSGKSTLSYVLMGHPKYKVEGSATLDSEDILKMNPTQRSKKGIFLAFQYPNEIPGVKLFSYLKAIYSAHKKQVQTTEFMRILKDKLNILGMSDEFIKRNLNEGFSGGEKKRAEILQMALLEPKIAVLDETDSGLDIDALKAVSEGINNLRNKEMGIILITHYQRILNYVKPDKVHILVNGKIVKSGGPEIAEHLEEFGYEKVKENV